jgi:hypothetical protein
LIRDYPRMVRKLRATDAAGAPLFGGSAGCSVQAWLGSPYAIAQILATVVTTTRSA